MGLSTEQYRVLVNDVATEPFDDRARRRPPAGAAPASWRSTAVFGMILRESFDTVSVKDGTIEIATRNDFTDFGVRVERRAGKWVLVRRDDVTGFYTR